MNQLTAVLTGLGLLTSPAVFGEEKTVTTETHDTDGKSTTRIKKVKRKADGKGGSEVKTETTQKTAVSTPSGVGGETSEKTVVHETDGKTTTRSRLVKRKADATGDSVRVETTHKTELK